jgi:hypothetical protein
MVGAGILFSFVYFLNRLLGEQSGVIDTTLYPVNSIYEGAPDNRVQGLGYDHQKKRLLFATRYGLFIQEKNKLFRVGTSTNRDNLTSLAINPLNPNLVYTSGYKNNGSQLGLLKSDDGGLTFQLIFSKTGSGPGQVVFRSLALNAGNPDIIYGYDERTRSISRSITGGKRWILLPSPGSMVNDSCWGGPCLAPDPHQEQRVYAGASNGIYVSENYGKDWQYVSSGIGKIFGVGVDPHNLGQLFVMSKQLGIAVSRDGGKTWKQINPNNNGLSFEPQETVFTFVFDPSVANHIFIATTKNHIYETMDGGMKWLKIF